LLQHTDRYRFHYFLPIADFSEKIEIAKVGVPLGARDFWTFTICHLIIINGTDPLNNNDDDSSILFAYILIALIIFVLFLIVDVMFYLYVRSKNRSYYFDV